MAAGLGLALALAAAAGRGAAAARPAAGGGDAAGADTDFRAQPLRAAAEGALELGASPGWISGWPSGPLAPWWAAEGVTVGDAMESAFGVLEGRGANLPELELESEQDPLPAAFDWREEMPACVGGIKDQGKCGSCWAVSTAEAFSDRLCLARHAAGQTSGFEMMSALDLIACDRKCEHPLLRRGCNMGCQGGFPSTAWEFVQKKGLHSDSCLPYDLSKQLLCPMHCADKSSLRTDPAQKTWSTFKTQGPHGLRELLNDGPITAVFTVYQDFMNYSSGIYEHNKSKKNRKIGYHAVKVVGWGTADDGTQFLICQNSWGPAWGEDGFFRIKLGDSGMGGQLFGGKVHVRKEEAFRGDPAQLMSPVP